MPKAAELQRERTVSELLYDTRATYGIEQREVSLKTKIPERYLRGLESGAYDDIPDDVYTKIYLKAYCAFLGLDSGPIMKRYRDERDTSEAAHVNARHKHPSKSISNSELMVAPKIIRASILGLLVFGLAVYFGFEVKKIITPPSVTLSSPKDGIITIERSVAIEGKTEREVALRINGKPVATDDGGNFKDVLDLQEGLNVITVIATKKYSKPMTVTRRIIVESPERPTASIMLGPDGL